ncbi:hypothetical protein ACFQ3Z_08440 [Streptomyces nogalater]
MTAQYPTHHTDLVAVAFDSAGRNLALLRRGGVIEVWGTDPLRRKIGPLPSAILPFTARFLDEPGRYLIASDNKIRVYRVDEQHSDLAYDLGPSDALDTSTPQYRFLDASRDGRTLLYYAIGDEIVYPSGQSPMCGQTVCAGHSAAPISPPRNATPSPSLCPPNRSAPKGYASGASQGTGRNGREREVVSQSKERQRPRRRRRSCPRTRRSP